MEHVEAESTWMSVERLSGQRVSIPYDCNYASKIPDACTSRHLSWTDNGGNSTRANQHEDKLYKHQHKDTEFVSTTFSLRQPNNLYLFIQELPNQILYIQHIVVSIPLFYLKAKQREMPLAKMLSCCAGGKKRGKHQLPLPVGEIAHKVG